MNLRGPKTITVIVIKKFTAVCKDRGKKVAVPTGTIFTFDEFSAKRFIKEGFAIQIYSEDAK